MAPPTATPEPGFDELAPARPLELPECGDLEKLTLSRGNLFAVAGRGGDIAPPGARDLGLFREDTRHLSYYQLVVVGGPPVVLSSQVVAPEGAQVDLALSSLGFAGELGEPQNFLHIRRKMMLDLELPSFVEQLVLTNHARDPVTIRLELRLGADFADIFEVRGWRRPLRGQPERPRVEPERLELSYRGLDGVLYRTVARFSPAPAALTASVASFCVELLPGESAVQEVVITAARDDELVGAGWPFDVRVARARGEARRFREGCTDLRADNTQLEEMLSRALEDLLGLRIRHGDRWIVGAGIPWFAAPFGRDAIITALEVLPFAPSLADEAIATLAAFQGRERRDEREEEPGRILHELRRGEMARAGEVPHTPYYGTVDATPLFVRLVAERFRWDGDRARLDATWPHVDAALGWIDARTDEGRRFLTYQRPAPRGLANQGWKDSRDGVSFPDGAAARAPIALVEVQGYVYDAYRCGAALASARGDAARAQALEARAEAFRRRLDEAFWVEETRYYALALDGEGRQVATITSNPGHLLFSGAVGAERAARVAEVLLSDAMYSGWGIRTLARGQAVFNPLSYHNGTVWPHDNALCAAGLARYGLQRGALAVLDGLYQAAHHFRQGRLPELFCGTARGEFDVLVQYPVSCSPQAWASGALFLLLSSVLGLEPDAPRRRLVIADPGLPGWIRRVELRDLRVGASRCDLEFRRDGSRCHVDVRSITGAPLRVLIEVGG